MYEFITGKIVDVKDDYVVLNNNGIGYKIFTSKNCINTLKIGAENVTMYTYLSVREDAMVLYGFVNNSELEMFKLLLKVSKIGPKIAVGILSSLTPGDIKTAILKNDIKTLCIAPGVGKKTANRITLELKDRIPDSIGSEDDEVIQADNYNDILEGLISLGYSKNESVQALKNLETDGMDIQEALKLALSRMANK